jgi:hypothetical protein
VSCKFLYAQVMDTIEAASPACLDLHLIVDDYATNQPALIRNWFVKRLRPRIHITPAIASWLNLVERWFALLIDKQPRR